MSESGWMPIESAPKDGTEFQAWVTNLGKYEWTGTKCEGFWEPFCRFNGDGAFEIWGRVDYDMEGWEAHLHLAPTHWMPLPEPPEPRS